MPSTIPVWRLPGHLRVLELRRHLAERDQIITMLDSLLDTGRE
jgi:hypothetical protein